ncbi:hypothetical protein SAMN05428959_10997 [Duganella sp. CF517]|uniref:BACON domain-containing protein n=1 Tax=Duganella sp. CF517 TaxID=1881038 RepID=UPI0008CD3528|nr:BACON domain-containing protein [Duganella sp. CF517]SEO52317.1 hypothetical protein SAMN05428959_10997 [Duganella sp. CF517]
MKNILCVLALAASLAACGGGGGGGGGSGGTPPQQTGGAALSFAPATVTASLKAGESSTIAVNATVNRPADFTSPTVFAFVTDNQGVLLPQLEFTATSPTAYTAVLHTSPSLAAGDYKGNFNVSVCRDAGCASHYPGSPMQLPYAITVGAAALPAFAATTWQSLDKIVNLGAPAAAEVQISVQGAGRQWSAASSTPWIKLSNTSGSGNGVVNVGYDLASLTPGTYAGAVTITTTDGQSATLPVALTVMASAFSVTQSGVEFNAVNGAPIAPQAISFNIDGLPAGSAWSASAANTWLGVTPAAGTTPGVATLSVDASKGALASGTYTSSVRLTSPSADPRQVSVTLNLTAPTLSLSAATVTLGGPQGRDWSAGQPVNLRLNTGANNWPWTIAGMPAWARASSLAGKTGDSGALVTLNAVQASAPTGSTSVLLTAEAKVNGDTVRQPLTLTINKDKHRLLPSATAVALVATPDWSRLTRTLTVADNMALAAPWSASSNQSWLSVAKSGNTLTLRADPAALAKDALHVATVTLASTDTTVAPPEPIRVALWNGAATPAAAVKTSVDYRNLVADPIRPYAYVHNGGSGIDVYNVYTAQRSAVITGVGAALGEMAVGPNGDRLYVYDTANATMVVVDLATQRKASSWALASAVGAGAHLQVIRPNGVEVVLAADGTAYLSSGKAIGASPLGGGAAAASADGKRLYVQNEGVSPASVDSYAIDYSEVGGGSLSSAQTASGWSIGGASNGADIAVAANAERVYAASGAPYACRTIGAVKLDFIGFLPGGDAYPNNVEVGSDGRIYCGISGWYSTADVWVYAADGSLLRTAKFAGYARALKQRQMAVSGDGMMLLALTDDPLLVFVPVGP